MKFVVYHRPLVLVLSTFFCGLQAHPALALEKPVMPVRLLADPPNITKETP
jgi:hypothetical protein